MVILKRNEKFDIVVDKRSGTSVYYIDDNSHNGDPFVWDVKTGELRQASEAVALQTNQVQVANIATMLALDIFNQ